MAYTRSFTVDSSPGGDTVKAAVATKLDGDLTNAFTYLNAHDIATTSVHGFTGAKTGSGAMVGANTPTLITPVLGVATATSINKVAITAPATAATLTISDGKTFSCSGTLTLAGTDGSTLNIGTGGTLGTAAYTAATAYEASGAVSSHAALLTGVHGLAITAGQTLTVTTGGTLGTAAYTAATAYDAAGTAAGKIASSISDGDTTHAPDGNSVFDALALKMALTGANLAIGSDADGDMYYRASGVLARLPKGTTLQQLRMNVGATAPEWAASSSITYASAAEDLAGAEAAKATAPLTNPQLIKNLKPVVNADVNELDIFTKSGGAAPDATNIIQVAIPDGNGYTFRSRNGAVASGTGQIAMANAGNYWSKGSLDAEIKTCWLYAIYSTADAGIVWALGGYSGFTAVPTTTTATDDDYFLLETSSTYTRAGTDYCIAVAKIRYQYDTADTPDHTIQASGENAPQVIWNPKSDYGKKVNLATTLTQGSDITEYSAVSAVAKQSGRYFASMSVHGWVQTTSFTAIGARIKIGSSTYASAVQVALAEQQGTTVNTESGTCCNNIFYMNAGDTIHGGARVLGGGGNRNLTGDNTYIGSTTLKFFRID